MLSSFHPPQLGAKKYLCCFLYHVYCQFLACECRQNYKANIEAICKPNNNYLLVWLRWLTSWRFMMFFSHRFMLDFHHRMTLCFFRGFTFGRTCYISLCRHILFGLGCIRQDKNTLGTLFYSNGFIHIPRYIVAKAKFV